MDKKTIRKEINKYFNEIPEKELDRQSRNVTDLLIQQEFWNTSRTILAFLTFGKEFETSFLIEQALNQGKKVAVPRICGKTMNFHYIKSLNDDFQLNKWNIREPKTEAPDWTPERGNALLISPGLAFNRSGGRLGRGGGFYDRFLSEHSKNITSLGVCFEKQIREDFPVEKHDCLLDALCSEKSYYLF